MDLFDLINESENAKQKGAASNAKQKGAALKRRDWTEEYIGMPEYINTKPLPPEITATFKFKNKDDYDSFMEIVQSKLYNGKRVFDGKQKKNEYSAWFPLPPRPSEHIYISNAPKKQKDE